MCFLISTPQVSQADVFRLLPRDRDAIQVRVDLIQQAQHEIDCAYYAADTGRVPAAILALLIEAAQRGVRVRLLVDGLMSRLPIGLHRALQAHGVEIHVYRPPENLCPLSLNQRMHDKLLIVDRHHLVVGSRNLQDAHFGQRSPQFIDCDAYIKGPTAAWAAAYYQWLWNHGHVQSMASVNVVGQTITRLLPATDSVWKVAWQNAHGDADYLHLLQASLNALEQQGFVQQHTGHCWSNGCDPHVDLEFVHESDTSKSQRDLQRRLLSLIHNAQHSILIQTPYPVFAQLDLQTIFDARQRNVRVVICTNSLASTDRLSTYSAFENTKDILLAAGVEIYEMPGPHHLHNKAVIIDDAISVVGSYNFDERSAHLNMEVSVIAYDAATAMQLRRIIESQMTGAHRVFSTPRLLDPRACDASRARHWKMHFGRLLAPAIRSLL